GNGFVVSQRPEAVGAGRVPLIGVEKTVGVRALQIALHALGTEHAAVEGEILPGLEAYHLVVLDLELDAALHAAEAAVRLYDPVRLDGRFQTRAGGVGAVRAEL